MQDYKQKKAALTKPQYIARVRQVLQTTKSQQVAKRIAGGFRKTCKEVDNKKGAAARSWRGLGPALSAPCALRGASALAAF